MYDQLLSAWIIAMDVPNPGKGSMPPGFERFTDLLGWAKWIMLGITVILLMAAFVKLGASSRTGDGEEHAGRIGKVLMSAIGISAAFTLVSFLAS